MTDLPEIIRLAEAATPGPWKQHLVDETTIVSEIGIEIGTTCDSSQAEREDAYNVEYERMEANAAFIAAANPATIKAMAERLMRLEEALRTLINASKHPDFGHFAWFFEDEIADATGALENKP